MHSSALIQTAIARFEANPIALLCLLIVDVVVDAGLPKVRGLNLRDKYMLKYNTGAYSVNWFGPLRDPASQKRRLEVLNLMLQDALAAND